MTEKISKAVQSRSHIIEKATELFLERGTDHVSVNDIITSLNISKGRFYYHFKSKNELIYEALIKDSFNIQTYYNDIKDTYAPSMLLKKVVVYMAHKIITINPRQFILYMSSALENEYSNHTYRKLFDKPIYKTYDKIISRGMEEGEFRIDIDREELVAAIFTLTLGNIFSWGYSNGRYDILDHVDTSMEIVLNGIIKK